jgi:signal transduction histidine kinase
VGLRNGAPFLIVFTIPIILAGLLAGRSSTVLIIGIGVATMLMMLTLERVAPTLIGFVPVGDSTSTVVVVFILVISVSGLFLDRFGHTLSTTLSEALARERELEQSRAALELRTSELEREIGERTKAETALRRLNDELEVRVAARTAALEAANKELEAFSYSVSHDLRAPLRVIDGFARILREDYTASLPDEAQQYFGYIRENAQRMNSLIDDLLAFSHLSRQPLTKGSVDVAELVCQCLHELESEQAGRQLAIHVGKLPACAGDRSLLKQVWFNLLSNALKYTRKRDVAEITVGSQRQGDDTVYFVQDNGAGFDMRYSNKLFGVFQRLHRAEEYEGTGVGLANVQRIVLRHGGRIWAEAAVNQGATFYFTLGSEGA